MVGPEMVAILCSVTTLTVYRWAEAGLVHFVKTSEGALFVCLNSLPGSAGKMAEQRLMK
jgi:predicted site-specific integrase-resolvase